MKVNIKIFVLIFLSSIFLILIFQPPRDDFHYSNTDWNGYSDIVSLFNAKIMGVDIDYNIVSKNFSKYCIIVIPFSKPDEEYLRFLENFVSGGGILIVLDDHAYGNNILESLKIDARFIHNGTINDPIFFYKTPELPKIIVDIDGRKISVYSNYASMIYTHKCKILGYTSKYSFFDKNFNGLWEQGEREGPLPVIVYCKRGLGGVYVLGDPDILSNFSMENSNATIFLKNIVDDKVLVIDERLLGCSIYARVRTMVMKALYTIYFWKELFILVISIITSMYIIMIYRR